MTKTILKLENISKAYSGVCVLHNVSLEIHRGEVHALCGENGAGKSTIVKILTGAVLPSSGYIEVNGEKFENLSPKESMNLGISVVYQEFSLIPYLTVVENIFYGREISRHGILDIKTMKQQAKDLCKKMGISLDINSRVCDLGVAYQQIVEIMKAVSRNCHIMILDEPTAPLTVKDTAVFFNLVKRLKNKGTTFIFISHRLEEVFEICDRVTVLCDGKKILTEKTSEINRQRLVSAMVGRNLTETYPRSEVFINNYSPIVLDVQKIKNKDIHNVSFVLRKGEILGFGGLVGAGRTELMRLLFGADPLESGEIFVNGKKYFPKSPEIALQAGIALIPENRKSQGIISSLSVKHNICICTEKKIAKYGIISQKTEKELAMRYIKNLNIKTASLDQQIRNLSGGNQQKVVLGKMLATNCQILIFDEPTRGIDVGAKQEIYELMVGLVREGKSIIMVSSEMPELIGMSDRIYVMANGRIKTELSRDNYSQELILEFASQNQTKAVVQ
ncbi:sugar ABC transporter ATP-binding protein [Treponema parvum]|uniref:Sugar ABC transporter ATP-binding protein n=1 Tax=Treponema parvum TaxID=138851 RepID=A0A975F5G2_9SPIR|nr:sugar ABC transporter ATP-binding protein [Treponema parvum]QTQ14841.1 sugar ABC transporter ATP-binding protein [Treponema parvum]